MDFLKEITQDCVVREYLKDFPEADWREVVKKTLLYGIHSLKALENLGLASPKFEKIPALHSELAEMKKTSIMESYHSSNPLEGKENRDSKKKLENSRENPRIPAKTRGISQKNTKEKSKTCQSAVLRGNSKDPIKQPPFKLTGKEKPEVRRKLPKYLQNIDSKIKDDVQKSKKNIVQTYTKPEKKPEEPNLKWDDLKNNETIHMKQVSFEENDESQKSSSSFSTYNAAEDVKEFYQKEFAKLLPFTTTEKKKITSDTRKNARLFVSSPSDSEA